MAGAAHVQSSDPRFPDKRPSPESGGRPGRRWMDRVPFSRGRAPPGQVAEIAASPAIFEHFDGVERPTFLDDRTHAWARADRLAWGEDEQVDLDGAPFSSRTFSLRAGSSQGRPGIIHGDLTGNVLFDDSDRRRSSTSRRTGDRFSTPSRSSPSATLSASRKSSRFCNHRRRRRVRPLPSACAHLQDRHRLVERDFPSSHFTVYEDANSRVLDSRDALSPILRA